MSARGSGTSHGWLLQQSSSSFLSRLNFLPERFLRLQGLIPQVLIRAMAFDCHSYRDRFNTLLLKHF